MLASRAAHKTATDRSLRYQNQQQLLVPSAGTVSLVLNLIGFVRCGHSAAITLLQGTFLTSKAQYMQVPSVLQRPSRTRLLQGMAVGAFATMFVGFYWGGWTLGGTAEKMAQKSANGAMISALAPICVEKFQHAADYSTNLIELKKVSTWQQTAFVEKGGWATFAGSTKPDEAVARACAETLAAVKVVQH